MRLCVGQGSCFSSYGHNTTCRGEWGSSNIGNVTELALFFYALFQRASPQTHKYWRFTFMSFKVRMNLLNSNFKEETELVITLVLSKVLASLHQRLFKSVWPDHFYLHSPIKRKILISEGIPYLTHHLCKTSGQTDFWKIWVNYCNILYAK